MSSVVLSAGAQAGTPSSAAAPFLATRAVRYVRVPRAAQFCSVVSCPWFPRTTAGRRSLSRLPQAADRLRAAATCPTNPGGGRSDVRTTNGRSSANGGNSSISSPIHIRPAELIDYWPAADLHCRVFNVDLRNNEMFKGLSLRVDRITALQINDRLALEGGGNSTLLLAFDGEAPVTPDQVKTAEAAFQAEAQAAATRGSPTSMAFPQPMWWLGRALAPGVRPGVGVSAQSVGLVGVAAVDSFGDLVPPRELNWQTDGRMGWYRREGYAYVSNVAVAPEARRRGVARRLMAAAEKLAAEWGCRAVGLHCNPKKREPWALYHSLGYRDSGVVEPTFMPYLQGRPPDRCSFLLKLTLAARRRKQHQPPPPPVAAITEGAVPSTMQQRQQSLEGTPQT
ncbi:hypothetical protein Vafri_20238 [Volvox africanus]|uniref:N-acetyltransferase domain-containing protein n=1 Tax=Volvox africanus TaxID=51714 RepID=A0A8J4BS70_9CHLO|nr:hypothetical protein Vafri_20238 [Volvox africanus]